jgi:hypothetical protein
MGVSQTNCSNCGGASVKSRCMLQVDAKGMKTISDVGGHQTGCVAQTNTASKYAIAAIGI